MGMVVGAGAGTDVGTGAGAGASAGMLTETVREHQAEIAAPK